VTLASTNDLLLYLADLVEELERYAVTLLRLTTATRSRWGGSRTEAW